MDGVHTDAFECGATVPLDFLRLLRATARRALIHSASAKAALEFVKTWAMTRSG